MDIREAIIQIFGKNSEPWAALKEHGLEWGVAIAKFRLEQRHGENRDAAAKTIRYWQPPDVLLKEVVPPPPRIDLPMAGPPRMKRWKPR